MPLMNWPHPGILGEGLFLSCGMPAMPLSSATPLSVYPFRLPLLHLERDVVDRLRYSLNFFSVFTEWIQHDSEWETTRHPKPFAFNDTHRGGA